jgi:menaquinol-cytochrome c reductase cytochrome b subunit
MTPPKPPLPNSLKRRPSRPGSQSLTGTPGGNGPNGRNGKAAVALRKQQQREKRKQQLIEIPVSIVGWLDERSGVSPILRAFLWRKTPRGTNWYYTLGSATLFAFLSQAVTGVFLAMYYDPSPSGAYGSIRHIINEVWLGELVRGMHKWGATVMVVLIFCHMGRTFVFGAYKYPRELNWIIGVVLLVLTLAMAFTGYLLPFDQRSFWATVVGVNINASGPIVGPYLADFLRAGPEFTATTLSRFYAIHMLLIPVLIAALIGAHIYLVTKLGTTAPPWLKAEKARDLAKEEV